MPHKVDVSTEAWLKSRKKSTCHCCNGKGMLSAPEGPVKCPLCWGGKGWNPNWYEVIVNYWKPEWLVYDDDEEVPEVKEDASLSM